MSFIGAIIGTKFGIFLTFYLSSFAKRGQEGIKNLYLILSIQLGQKSDMSYT